MLTFFNAAIGFGGILISGRQPIGGGSKFCGDRAGDGRAPLDGGCGAKCAFGGTGGGGGGPLGKT